MCANKISYFLFIRLVIALYQESRVLVLLLWELRGDRVKFDSCNNLLSSVHAACIILRSVRMCIKREYYIVVTFTPFNSLKTKQGCGCTILIEDVYNYIYI